METFIIAEAGANHDGRFEQAIALIDAAKAAGASACKFQTYSADTLYCRNTPDFAGYENVYALIDRIAINRRWQAELKRHCDQVRIEFMSTPFDEAAVQELVDIGVRRLKVAGFESTDTRFLEMVASARLPLLVSVGIGSTRQTVERLLEIAHKHGCGEITLLHCNNAYPTPQEDIRLETIPMLREWFDVPVGLSDHTQSVITPALAVALGACAIEKHFTMSRSLPGPDHAFALEPEELSQMVAYIRQAERSMGTRQEALTPSEQAFANAQRSVVTRAALKKGHVLTVHDLTTKRPYLPGAVAAFDYYRVIGKRLAEDVPGDVPLPEAAICGDE